MATKPKMKTVYMLRIRMADDQPWSEPTEYQTRQRRDREARYNRIMGGIRTHSYEERRAIAEEPAGCEASGHDLRERVAK